MAVKFAAIMLNEQPVAEHIHPPSSEQRWLGCPRLR
jgi:hypothetical protein